MRRGNGDIRWRALAVRLYAALLILYPPRFRRCFGAEMIQAFRDGLREAHGAGGIVGALGWWLHGLADLGCTAAGEWGSQVARLWRLAGEGSRDVAAVGQASTLTGGGHGMINNSFFRQLARRGRPQMTRPTFQRVPSEDLARFTGRARQSIALAREEARGLGHGYIGTEHLLLGLLAEGGGIAARALAVLSVELEDVRTRIEDIIGRRDRVVEGDALPLTPRASRVIELAMVEAWRLKHPYIGTEHLLLGMLAEGEGIAAGVLDECGLQLDQVRAKVLELLPPPPPEVPPSAVPWMPM